MVSVAASAAVRAAPAGGSASGSSVSRKGGVLPPSPMQPDSVAAATAAISGARNLRIMDILIRSEEHTSELKSLMRISYAVFCLKTKKTVQHKTVKKIQQ